MLQRVVSSGGALFRRRYSTAAAARATRQAPPAPTIAAVTDLAFYKMRKIERYHITDAVALDVLASTELATLVGPEKADTSIASRNSGKNEPLLTAAAASKRKLDPYPDPATSSSSPPWPGRSAPIVLAIPTSWISKETVRSSSSSLVIDVVGGIDVARGVEVARALVESEAEVVTGGVVSGVTVVVSSALVDVSCVCKGSVVCTAGRVVSGGVVVVRRTVVGGLVVVTEPRVGEV
jgi:hypothetical protein